MSLLLLLDDTNFDAILAGEAIITSVLDSALKSDSSLAVSDLSEDEGLAGAAPVKFK